MVRRIEDLLSAQELTGLRPGTWICVGQGFSREDLKAALLSQGIGFVGDAFQTVQSLCLKIRRGHGAAEARLLSGAARQEALRLLLAEPRIGGEMPELKRLKRQSSFYRRLDLAIQNSRQTFAHWEEEQVYQERLAQRLPANPVRDEVRRLARAYEAWLEGTRGIDLPLLMRTTVDLLETKGWPDSVAMPSRILWFQAQTVESLEKSFWDAMKRWVSVEQVDARAFGGQGKARLVWERWHTLDDAADALAESWTVDFEARCTEEVVLIADQSAVRRSLKRALDQQAVSLADPRDPTRLKWDESIKWAMLPLQVVSRGYERTEVIAWLRAFQLQEEFPRWVMEIQTRGVRSGLQSYAGGILSGVHSRLNELHEDFGYRRTCEELAERHLSLLRRAAGLDPARAQAITFFEQVWSAFVDDQRWLGQSNRRAPLLYWLDRLNVRVQEAPAPVERLKPTQGMATYRLHQAPLKPHRRVWILGLPPDWLGTDGQGDYWYSEREREVLGAEFSVRSAIQVREDRLGALHAWLSGAEEVVVLDSQYAVDGRERDTILPVLRDLLPALAGELPEAPEEKGAHPRWLASFGALRPVPPQRLSLPAAAARDGQKIPEITATLLDSYSRCPMQALAYHRWRLKDTREADAELWPEAKGNILHEAIRLLMLSRGNEGQFTLSVSDALDQAWQSQRPKGLIRSNRMERYLKSRLALALDAFCAKEREYFDRAGTKVVSLDDMMLRLEYEDFAIVGQPDRIDEHPDGVFILDYKSSSDLPTGADMLELGYRLQLPFYALAEKRRTGREVLGVQFVQLDNKGTRSKGVFFKRHNGKEPGKLTNVRSNVKSLMSIEPAEAWSRFEDHLVTGARAYLAGQFEAKPRTKRREEECKDCRMSDLCGYRRLVEVTSDE